MLAEVMRELAPFLAFLVFVAAVSGTALIVIVLARTMTRRPIGPATVWLSEIAGWSSFVAVLTAVWVALHPIEPALALVVVGCGMFSCVIIVRAARDG